MHLNATTSDTLEGLDLSVGIWMKDSDATAVARGEIGPDEATQVVRVGPATRARWEREDRERQRLAAEAEQRHKDAEQAKELEKVAALAPAGRGLDPAWLALAFGAGFFCGAGIFLAAGWLWSRL